MPKETISFMKDFKCAVSNDTEAGIAHCGRFLICLCYTYCLIPSLLSAQTSLHIVRLWS